MGQISQQLSKQRPYTPHSCEPFLDTSLEAEDTSCLEADKLVQEEKSVADVENYVQEESEG